MRNGVPMLIEKPIADAVDEAMQLVDAGDADDQCSAGQTISME